MLGLTDQTLHAIIDYRLLSRSACLKPAAMRLWLANVRACMAKKQIRQTELAKQCRASAVWLCYILSGSRKPSVASMVRIARALGIEPPDDMWLPRAEFFAKHLAPQSVCGINDVDDKQESDHGEGASTSAGSVSRR